MNERVLDVASAVSAACGQPCPREALGVIAAPRGSMTGCVMLLPQDVCDEDICDDDVQSLRHGAIFQVPGDTEAVRALRLLPDSSVPAACVLVVEKDSVFRRLVDDGFLQRLPCVLITGCGVPDLATRCLVRRVVDALRVRCYCLTDYNPHGIALMLAYRHGTSNLGLESGCCCPSLRWLGLRAAHVRHATEEDDDEMMFAGIHGSFPADDDCVHVGEGGDDGGMSATLPLPASSFQAFTQRDRAVLAGLAKRTTVLAAPELAWEVEQMALNEEKVEIEALYCHGFGYLSRFVAAQILIDQEESDDEGEDLANTEPHQPRHRPFLARGESEDAEDDMDDSQARGDEEGRAMDDWDEDDRWLLEGPPDDW